MSFELLLLTDHYNGLKIGGIPAVPTSLDHQRREVCNDLEVHLLKVLSLKQQLIMIRSGKSIMFQFIHSKEI